ncbi:MAG: hypothetical protein Q9183_004002 [Haloplaca sp. 2 TL-2023]
MSGTNPFRRKDNPTTSQSQPDAVVAGSDAVERAGLRFPPIDTDVPKSTKTKTVRIISPHYSRSKDDGRTSNISSPPPQGFDSPSPDPVSPPFVGSSSPADPFSAQSDEGTSADDDEDLRRNTIANTASVGGDNYVSLNPPLNLSRKAPALRFGADAATSEHGDNSQGASAQSTSRPHYDVDAFKRLLLTGKKPDTDKTVPGQPPVQVQGSQGADGSSNIDTSVSRQPISEPHQPTFQESPRASIDIGPLDDGRHSQVPSAPKMSQNRPSAPPSRHGKLVKQNISQAASFDSLSSPPPEATSSKRYPTSPSPPRSPNSGAGVNKPLPPAPRSESPTAAVPVPDGAQSHNPEEHQSNPRQSGRLASKRSPPAVPAARRHGQGRSRSSTNDSSRSASISEDTSQNTQPSPSTSMSTMASKPPPLPPPRRAGTVPDPGESSPTFSLGSGVDPSDSTPFKTRPPLPPSRTASATSIKRLSRIKTDSGSFGGPPPPPPPPPPRRRGSSLNQSSTPPSETVGEDSSTTIGRQPPGEKDLVADLATLQREVDELRGQFGR